MSNSFKLKITNNTKINQNLFSVCIITTLALLLLFSTNNSSFGIEPFEVMSLDDFLLENNIKVEYVKFNDYNENGLQFVNPIIHKESDNSDLTISGYVQSNLQKPVENVKIEFNFYDSENRLVGTYEKSPIFNYIEPGESSPINMKISSSVPDSQIEKANLLKIKIIGSETTKIKEPVFKVKLGDVFEGKYGKYNILGEVTNTGESESSLLGVEAVLFNKENQIIDTVIGSVNDWSLLPNQTSVFEVDFYPDKKSEIAYAKLYVDDIYNTMIDKGLEVTLQIPKEEN